MLNYAKLVENMLKAYPLMSARMVLKMHFLHSHFNFFVTTLGCYKERQICRMTAKASASRIIEHVDLVLSLGLFSE